MTLSPQPQWEKQEIKHFAHTEEEKQVRVPLGCLQVGLFPGQRLPAPALRASRRREEVGICVLGLHSPQTTVMKQNLSKLNKFSHLNK